MMVSWANVFGFFSSQYTEVHKSDMMADMSSEKLADEINLLKATRQQDIDRLAGLPPDHIFQYQELHALLQPGIDAATLKLSQLEDALIQEKSTDSSIIVEDAPTVLCSLTGWPSKTCVSLYLGFLSFVCDPLSLLLFGTALSLQVPSKGIPAKRQEPPLTFNPLEQSPSTEFDSYELIKLTK